MRTVFQCYFNRLQFQFDVVSCVKQLEYRGENKCLVAVRYRIKYLLQWHLDIVVENRRENLSKVIEVNNFDVKVSEKKMLRTEKTRIIGCQNQMFA